MLNVKSIFCDCFENHKIKVSRKFNLFFVNNYKLYYRPKIHFSFKILSVLIQVHIFDSLDYRPKVIYF